MKTKLDFKTIIIIALLLGVIGMILFWPKNIPDYDKKEIERLRQENVELLNQNDSLSIEISKKDTIILKAENEIFNLENYKDSLDLEIEKINNRRNETTNYVNSLDADGISNGITDYIKRRKSNN